MLRVIHLHGRLAEQYTDVLELTADNLYSVVAGLESNFPGFREDFIDGEWHIIRGDAETGSDMSMEQVELNFGDKCTDIHIYPKLEGAGGKNGTWQVILGIVIIAVAWWAAPAGAGLGGAAWGAEAGLGLTYGQVAMFGLSMAMSGAAAMMAPTPNVGDMLASERAQDRPSFMFNGATNVMVAGGPVPLVYGEFETGSTVISAGISVEKT